MSATEMCATCGKRPRHKPARGPASRNCIECRDESTTRGSRKRKLSQRQRDRVLGFNREAENARRAELADAEARLLQLASSTPISRRERKLVGYIRAVDQLIADGGGIYNDGQAKFIASSTLDALRRELCLHLGASADHKSNGLPERTRPACADCGRVWLSEQKDYSSERCPRVVQLFDDRGVHCARSCGGRIIGAYGEVPVRGSDAASRIRDSMIYAKPPKGWSRRALMRRDSEPVERLLLAELAISLAKRAGQETAASNVIAMVQSEPGDEPRLAVAA